MAVVRTVDHGDVVRLRLDFFRRALAVCLSALALGVVVSCGSVSGSEHPTGSPGWDVSPPVPDVSLRYVVHVVWVAAPTELNQIDQVASAGDVNHDGFGDLLVTYQTSSGLHRFVVLSGDAIPTGQLSKLGKRVVIKDVGVQPNFPLTLGRYRTSPLPDLDGDGVAERAVMRTRHQTVRFSCGESGDCSGWYSASELTLLSGGTRIVRLGGDWYWSPVVYRDGQPVNTVSGGYQAMGDWNGDGRPDLLYDNPTFGPMVLLFTRTGLKAQRFNAGPGFAPSGRMPASVDLDSDGSPDIAEAVGLSTRSHLRSNGNDLAIAIFSRR
jgi:hypothetical protein